MLYPAELRRLSVIVMYCKSTTRKTFVGLRGWIGLQENVSNPGASIRSRASEPPPPPIRSSTDIHSHRWPNAGAGKRRCRQAPGCVNRLQDYVGRIRATSRPRCRLRTSPKHPAPAPPETPAGRTDMERLPAASLATDHSLRFFRPFHIFNCLRVLRGKIIG